MRLLHDCYVQRYFAPGDTNVFTGPNRPLGSNGTMDAVKVHRPRDWASRGDDFGRQAPQHFLYFLPLPQGQRSFRPDLGACNRIVFRLRARRYKRRNRAWRLAKTVSKSGRTSLSASTKSCPDHRPSFAPESGSICPVSYAYRMQRVGSLAIPLCWAEWRSSKNERAAS